MVVILFLILQAWRKHFSLSYRLCSERDLCNIDIRDYGIVEFVLSGQTKVSPKLEYNQPLFNMIPYLDKQEIDLIISELPQ